MRWLEPEVTTAATFSPVALDDAKRHLKIDGTDEHDDDVESLIAAAVGHIENRTGLTLATSTLTLRAYGLDCSEFCIPAAPVTGVAITYTDLNGASQTLSSSVYVTALAGLEPRIALAYGQTWPAHRTGLGAVSIAATCGYIEGRLPVPILQSIKLIVGDWFKHRENVAEGVISPIPMQAIDSLLFNYRRASPD